MIVPTSANIDEILSGAKTINGIPKIFHQMWYGRVPGPSGTYTGPGKYLDRIPTFKAHNPDWIHVLWTNDTIDQLFCRYPDYLRVARKMKHPIQVSDIARFMILEHWGGVYADLDFTTLRPIDDLLEDFSTEEMVIFHEWDVVGGPIHCCDCLINNCIISVPGASIIKELILNMESLIKYNPPEIIVLQLTGPRAIHEYLYGPLNQGKRPIWMLDELTGKNRGRVNNRTYNELIYYFEYPRGDNSGWIGEMGIWIFEYCSYYVALFAVLIILLWCLVLYFGSPYLKMRADLKADATVPLHSTVAINPPPTPPRVKYYDPVYTVPTIF